MYKNDTLKQITCIERLDDNAVYFDKLTKNIKCGRADEDVRDMVGWNAVSDLDPFDYEEILDHACSLNEKIVYDDGVYLLAANNVIIVLYKYVEIGKEDYDRLRQLVSTMTYYEALNHLKGYNVSEEFENEYFDCNFGDIAATILKENRYGGCIVSPNIEYWVDGSSEPIRVSFYKGINK
jgi:hypothetical protein